MKCRPTARFSSRSWATRALLVQGRAWLRTVARKARARPIRRLCAALCSRQEKMNTLSIVANGYAYEVDGVPAKCPHRQTDFRVDDIGLGKVFKFESSRPWFGQTIFEEFPGDEDFIAQLRGLREAVNQFGTKRFVLYKCHCGCDYCGILSCEIERRPDVVLWRDIRYEEQRYSGRVINEYRFDPEQYDQAIERYRKLHNQVL